MPNESNEMAAEDSAELMSQTTIYQVPRPMVQRHLPEHARSIRVEVVGGPMDGLRKRTEGDQLTIGRKPGSDMVLPMDPLVSSRHGRIVLEDSTYWLEDLDSRNGTFLGDRKLNGRIPIGPGVSFQVGHTQIDFMPR